MAVDDGTDEMPSTLIQRTVHADPHSIALLLKTRGTIQQWPGVMSLSGEDGVFDIDIERSDLTVSRFRVVTGGVQRSADSMLVSFTATAHAQDAAPLAGSFRIAPAPSDDRGWHRQPSSALSMTLDFGAGEEGMTAAAGTYLDALCWSAEARAVDAETE